MASDPQKALRTHLLELLGKGGAHADFASAVADLDAKHLNQKLPNVPHSAWGLVEHMRIAQADILAFSRDARHQSPKWPQGYWPTVEGTAAKWAESVTSFTADRAAFIAMIEDSDADLLAPFPHGKGQTLAREAMLLADHTAYHLGQLIIVRRGLGAWSE